ncbi:MAG: Uncharacterized protein Athens101410_137 [Parcubacteria group bacterium Athens1014_10]|nr:MAG: Uncharacterized protein Athens101410_137 [Parcubacteria group bacterium Athens1014_10]TSD05894.1 MAG: Uncharacterized protein Athens071412_176 [Parcubacteria group bacterium Athens0714_12]
MTTNKSKIFLYFCLSFILGVALRSFFDISFFQSYILFLTSLVIAILSPKTRWLAMGGFFLFLGILIYNLNLPELSKNKISFYNNQNQNISFQGIIAKEPEIEIDKQNLTIESEAAFINQRWQKISGRVLIGVKLYPRYSYGDRIEIKCGLKSPEKIENFDYAAYLSPQKIYSLCYYPKIKILSDNQGNAFLAKILKIKNKLQSIINYSLPEPHASLFSAIFLGNRSALPQELLEKFKRAGISHIIAISGLHVAIIGLILSNLFLLFCLPKKYAFYLSSVSLFLFVVLTGARSSVIRAGIMGFLILLAEKEGRLKNSLNALVFTAALMILFNPFLLKNDIGFQLSFLAVLGIIYFYPFFDNLKFLQKLPDFLKSIFSVTLSAQLATLPLIIYYFHYYSIIAPLTNLLILPALPLMMALGFLFIFIGLFYPPLAKFLFVFVYLILDYIIKITGII